MHIDKLGHPIEVGMLVLTNDYYDLTMSLLTTVKKITPRAIIIHVNKYDHSTSSIIKNHPMRRHPNQVIVVEQQLNYNKKEFPEYSI
jgi:hypothetical protein